MGRDKTRLSVGGRALVDIARAALVGAGRTVVVGAGHEVVEDPPGSGPVAALRAGLELVSAPVVVLLAADLPFVTAAAVEALAAAAPAVAVDGAGRDQHLLAAYPVDLLRAALGGNRAGDGSLDGVPTPGRDRLSAAGDGHLDGVTRQSRDRMSAVTAALAPQRLSLPGEPWWDCDTPAELAAARRRAIDATAPPSHHDHL